MKSSPLAAPAAILLALSLGSCSYGLRVQSDPPDAQISVDGRSLPDGAVRLRGASALVEVRRQGYVAYRAIYHRRAGLRSDLLRVRLLPEEYPVRIDSLPPRALLRIDGGEASPAPFVGDLPYGRHRLSFSAPGYPELPISLDLGQGGEYLFRLQHEPLPELKPLGIFACGAAPKQVTFSPDGLYAYISLLGGRGFDILDLRHRSLSKVELAGYGPKTGFVEGIFPEGASTFLLSQMTTNSIHVFSVADESRPSYLETFSTQGVWPKVMAYDRIRSRLAVSNWVSSDVAVLDASSGSLRRLLRNLGTPRGLVFSPDGGTLFVASYGEGRLYGFDAATWERRLILDRPGGALRHLVLSPDGSRLFVSDMASRRVLELEVASSRLLREYRTASNPNTIDLGPGGRLLAVSCRGPNSAEGYLERSPEPGRVLLFDSSDGSLVATIDGGAQPTGLDLSPDGSLLAFTNFQDATVELYDLRGLSLGGQVKGGPAPTVR